MHLSLQIQLLETTTSPVTTFMAFISNKTKLIHLKF